MEHERKLVEFTPVPLPAQPLQMPVKQGLRTEQFGFDRNEALQALDEKKQARDDERRALEAALEQMQNEAKALAEENERQRVALQAALEQSGPNANEETQAAMQQRRILEDSLCEVQRQLEEARREKQALQMQLTQHSELASEWEMERKGLTQSAEAAQQLRSKMDETARALDLCRLQLEQKEQELCVLRMENVRLRGAVDSLNDSMTALQVKLETERHSQDTALAEQNSKYEQSRNAMQDRLRALELECARQHEREQALRQEKLALEQAQKQQQAAFAEQASRVIAQATRQAEAVVAQAKTYAETVCTQAQQEAQQQTDEAWKLAREVREHAQQEAQTLQTQVRQEMQTLRAHAQQEAQTVKTQAQQQAETLRAQAQQEAQNLRTQAQQETQNLRTQVQQEAKILKAQAQREAQDVTARARQEAQLIAQDAQTARKIAEQAAEKAREDASERLQTLKTRLGALDEKLLNANESLQKATEYISGALQSAETDLLIVGQETQQANITPVPQSSFTQSPYVTTQVMEQSPVIAPAQKMQLHQLQQELYARQITTVSSPVAPEHASVPQPMMQQLFQSPANFFDSTTETKQEQERPALPFQTSVRELTWQQPSVAAEAHTIVSDSMPRIYSER